MSRRRRPDSTLESRADNRLRMLQLSETLKDAKEYLDSYAVWLAGELNLDLVSCPGDFVRADSMCGVGVSPAERLG